MPRPSSRPCATASAQRPRRARAGRLPARADAVALPGRHACPRARRATSPRTSRPARRSPSPRDAARATASSCTPRCTSAPTGGDGLGFNTAVARRPVGRARGAARARPTSRSPPATTRTSTSARARPTTPYPVYAPDGPRRAARPADLLGRVVPRGRARSTRSAARRWSSTRPPSAPSPTIPTSTPSRCGSRSSSATASPTDCSWSCPTAYGDRGRASPSTARRSSPTRTAACSSQAPRDEPRVLVADLDLAQRADWLDLFPFLRTRRPDTYGTLADPVDAEHPRRRHGADVRVRGVSWRMPAETARTSGCGWRSRRPGYTLGETAEDAEVARRTWAAVAQRRRRVRAGDAWSSTRATRAVARRAPVGRTSRCSRSPLDDAWMRDIGPTFVRRRRTAASARSTGSSTAGARRSGRRWEHDAQLGAAVAERAGAELVRSPLVNEGGGIHVDGAGHRAGHRDRAARPGPQPGRSRRRHRGRARAHASARRTAIWLPRGLTRDYDALRHPRPRRHRARRSRRPGACCCTSSATRASRPRGLRAAARAARAAARRARASRSRSSTCRPRARCATTRASSTSRTSTTSSSTAASSRARSTTRRGRAAPPRSSPTPTPAADVVTVDARPLFERGGGIHCITQQQPSL